MNVILASRSPRRRELMTLVRTPFTVTATDVDETMDPGKDPFDEVARVSALKARAIACGPDDIVIAADTIVVCDGQILGKPADAADAVRTLTTLSGRAHQVMTGLALRRGDRLLRHTEVTQVYFRDLEPSEILDYVRSGDPMDKAGSYGIQSGAAKFAYKLEGDYFNVVGLPVCRLSLLLKQIMEEDL